MIVPHGFDSPHSYRGFYEDLAFKPKENARIGDMLIAAKMEEWTNCWIAEYGNGGGDKIGPTILKLWECCMKLPEGEK